MMDEAAVQEKSLDSWGLDSQVVANLQSMGLQYLFPVQASILQTILSPFPPHRDVCVCAPTGSGKTLAYALPLTQILINEQKNRVVRQLRVLVLVPTRDLALQVKGVFDKVVVGTSIKVGIVIGQTSFHEEQRSLVPNDTDTTLHHGSPSLVDVLIATPGRLIDHMQGTKGFTLAFLTHLVVDEADRLLMQRYQDWLNRVLTAAHVNQSGSITQHQDFVSVTTLNPRVPIQDIQSWRSNLNPPLRKLLFSATLTRNPTKIANLKLSNPRYFTTASVPGRYVIPDSLVEYLILSKGGEKPLVLLGLLRKEGFGGVIASEEQKKMKKEAEEEGEGKGEGEGDKKEEMAIEPIAEESQSKKRAIVFVSSVEATHRLYQLLTIMGLKEVAEYSGHLPQASRTSILNSFRQGEIRTLIWFGCDDAWYGLARRRSGDQLRRTSPHQDLRSQSWSYSSSRQERNFLHSAQT
eukprot:TRINITY_DN4797_c0_g1_i2.p1 TRINITY_DN4797_c0_g1~~TRINITY_DN4797_c0_g1_i2.p1  ORF type:complete len:534 (-),score=125.62 TRINITY_DN4797_c0_g1_i2:177-1568(-)